MRKSSGFEWSYRDQLIAMLIAFMAMAALAMIAVTKKDSKAVTPGDVMFQMTWDRASLSDVDLWVQAPGDRPVGFEHPSGRYCNLLRDDLGRASDPESRNMELAVCRGMPDGEWIATAMLYAFRGGPLPVAVRVVATRASPDGIAPLASANLLLGFDGDEQTAFRFTLVRHRLVSGSVNQLPARLFLWRGGQ